jgi:60 kDa SS-A/Ro ribonucleoprotein
MSKALNSYLSDLNAPAATPQTKAASEKQVANNAGGYSFVVSDANRLVRFLVLGTDGGTYYVSQKDLTKQAIQFLADYAKRDSAEYLETLLSVVRENRAPKADYALFAFAVLYKNGSDKAAYRAALPLVARTSTHLFDFVGYLKGLNGFSTSAQKAVAAWYTNKPTEKLALQTVKYRQRNGYTHRDILRLAHPKGLDESIVNFVLGKGVTETAPAIIRAFQKAQSLTAVKDAVSLIKENNDLPWEAFPTSFHKEASFWKAQFETGMGATALLRNVTRFAKLGLFDDIQFAGDVAKALMDRDAIKAGRLHPVNYLNAYFVFTQGAYREVKSYYGKTKEREAVTWDRNPKIVAALEEGYYAAFGNVESSGKRVMLSLDVSGSMSSPVNGLAGLDCREASVAMAQVSLHTEDYVTVNAFTHGTGPRWSSYSSRRDVTSIDGLEPLDLNEKDSLAESIAKVSRLPFGGTDCSLPMRYALQKKIAIDTFVVYTDSETWAGPQHPHEALEAYRKAMGIQARLIVVGMEGNEFTIADPSDPLMLDVVGFDSAAPRIMADFSAGNL